MKIIMAEKSDIYHDSRVLKEARSLANAGYDVSVYGFREKWKAGEPKKYNFNITTFPVVSRKYRALRNISIFINIFIIHIIIILTKAQYYHAHNTMFLLGMYVSSRIHSGKFIYDSHEVQWERIKIHHILEKLFVHKAHRIISVSEGIAGEIRKRYSIPEESIIFLSNYPYLPNSKIDLTKKINPQNIRLIYSGGFDLLSNRLDNLLHALADLKQFSLYLLSYGYGDSLHNFNELIHQLGLVDRVHFLPLVSPDEIHDVVKDYDIAVSLTNYQGNATYQRYASPNKMYDYLAAGLPILCSNMEVHETCFVAKGVAISVDPNDVKSIVSGLKRISDNPEKIIKMRETAVALSSNVCHWGTQEIKLINMYKRMGTV